MSFGDQFMLALCAWRENRHGQTPGMQSVINVIMNRTYQRKTSPYEEVIRYKQISSITAPGDPQLAIWPMEGDPAWGTAQTLSSLAMAGALQDITDGATSYYAISMKEPPYWAPDMTKTVIIAGQQFLK